MRRPTGGRAGERDTRAGADAGARERAEIMAESQGARASALATLRASASR
ncbi:hypothetical protein [Streptomyces collinus]|nr:hypothetical protein [Streptomyces collinus]